MLTTTTRFIAIAHICLGLLACSSSPPPTDFSNFTFQSRDWINQQFHDLYISGAVKRIDDRSFKINYEFGVPLDPQSGLNPTEFHFFAYCLSATLAAQTGHPAWAIGSKHKNLKYKNVKELELFTVVLDEKQDPTTASTTKDISWMPPVPVEKSKDMCNKMLKQEYAALLHKAPNP